MITITPNKTEKTFTLSSQGIYSFIVTGSTSKQAIKSAVEKEYQVTIVSIRTVNRDGKPRRYLTKNRTGYRHTTLQGRKIAYVTLKAGDKIKMFDEEEVSKDAAQDAKTVAKELKTVAKKNRAAAKGQEKKS
jgi:large subunit ribosomal protein L23